MKITAKINGENQALVDTLTQRGVIAKLVRGGVVVDLPLKKRGYHDDWNNPDIFEVPAEVNGSMLFIIDITEHGGGHSSTGVGEVVCGLSGKPLRPYYTPRGGHLACGTHAYFAVPGSVVNVTGFRQDASITITQHTIVRDGNTARIDSRVLWSGEAPAIEWRCSSCDAVFTDKYPESHHHNGSECWGSPSLSKLALPETFDRFQAPAIAAREKAHCYHCRCVHYAST